MYFQTEEWLEHLRTASTAPPGSQPVPTTEGEALEIDQSLRSLAEAHGCELGNILWWDIDPHTCVLLVDLHRPDGVVIPLMLAWKKASDVQQDAVRVPILRTFTWIFDPTLKSRYRFEIGCDTFIQLQDAFRSLCQFAELPPYTFQATAASG